MTTAQTEQITPEKLGLSLIVCSGPRGAVMDKDWPCIEYTLQLMRDGRPVWTGDYRLGVGHVKAIQRFGYTIAMSESEKRFLAAWQAKPHANFLDKQLWAETAARLAKAQKVEPKLEDVCHSLLMDGSAFFDGETFEDWCGSLGYDTDSIKAKETFDACDKTGRELMRGLGRDNVKKLREWAQNY